MLKLIAPKKQVPTHLYGSKKRIGVTWPTVLEDANCQAAAAIDVSPGTQVVSLRTQRIHVIKNDPGEEGLSFRSLGSSLAL